ncbi:MAG: hypothetical protein H0W16_07565 [Actinobacteria bacterium]|nr:hypothetical protein [Actinomycetota bacterium]
MTVSEPTAARVAVLEDRFRKNPRVHTRVIDFNDPPDAEYSANGTGESRGVVGDMLEHVSPLHAVDVRRVFVTAAKLVRRGGKVVEFVPAFPFAMRFDRELGH